jgi:hypothetical protein
MLNKTSVVLAFFVAAVLSGLFLRFNTRESFMQKDVGMPLNAPGMGPYDGVGAQGWSANEPTGETALPLGSSGDNHLMLLSDNKVSADCCPSQFTSDTGCVCLNEQDKNMFASRGGNRT